MQQIEGILNEFTEQAKQVDERNRKLQRQLTEQWFSAGLFSCRSSLAIDYVSETRQLWQQLQKTQNPSAKQFIAHQVSDQLLALQTALKNQKLPRENQDVRLKQQTYLTHLHQQLATHRGYEQRLQQAVNTQQLENNTAAAQQQQKRLNRCQQAISELEMKIQKLEEGR